MSTELAPGFLSFSSYEPQDPGRHLCFTDKHWRQRLRTSAEVTGRFLARRTAPLPPRPMIREPHASLPQVGARLCRGGGESRWQLPHTVI